MGKSPAFQFYVRDWLSDPQLKMASHQSKGIWIDLLCYMWEAPERGSITGTIQEFCRMLGTTDPEFIRFLDEAKRLKFASVTESNGKVTLENRRMMREEKERKNNALRQARFKSNAKGNGESNEKVTSPSSSSSSSSKKKERNIKKEKDQVPDGKPPQNFLESLKSNPAYKHIDIDIELSKMDAWLSLPKNKRRQKTPTFVLNWLNKIEAPIDGNGDKPVIGLTEEDEKRIAEIERRERERS